MSYFTAPSCAILREFFPGVSVDVEAFQRGFYRVCIAFLLSAFGASTILQFSLNYELWYTIFSHSGYVTSPSKLRLTHNDVDTHQIGFGEHYSVRNFVFPLDL
jgi:hypothetical protein